jgi:hypothetical protein
VEGEEERMKEETRKTILAIFIAFMVIFGGYLGFEMWRTTVIIADTQAPEIDESKTTHGHVAYSPTLTVKCIVRENIEMDKVTADLLRIGDYIYEPSQVYLETITLQLISQDGEVYTYAGTFSASVVKGETYQIHYVATDKAGWQDVYDATITLVGLEGYVTINGQKVEPDDTIRIRTLELDIRVYITVGSDSVDKIYGSIDGETLTFKYQQPFLQTPYWGATYTLPGDGTYELIVNVRDKAGTETRLASFTIQVGYQQKHLMILAVVFVLVAMAVIGYYARTRRQRKKR